MVLWWFSSTYCWVKPVDEDLSVHAHGYRRWKTQLLGCQLYRYSILSHQGDYREGMLSVKLAPQAKSTCPDKLIRGFILTPPTSHMDTVTMIHTLTTNDHQGRRQREWEDSPKVVNSLVRAWLGFDETWFIPNRFRCISNHKKIS